MRKQSIKIISFVLVVIMSLGIVNDVSVFSDTVEAAQVSFSDDNSDKTVMVAKKKKTKNLTTKEKEAYKKYIKNWRNLVNLDGLWGTEQAYCYFTLADVNGDGKKDVILNMEIAHNEYYNLRNSYKACLAGNLGIATYNKNKMVTIRNIDDTGLNHVYYHINVDKHLYLYFFRNGFQCAESIIYKIGKKNLKEIDSFYVDVTSESRSDALTVVEKKVRKKKYDLLNNKKDISTKEYTWYRVTPENLNKVFGKKQKMEDVHIN